MNPTIASATLDTLTQQMTQHLTHLIQTLGQDIHAHGTTLTTLEQTVVPAIRALGATLITTLCGRLTPPAMARTVPCAGGQQAAFQRMRTATVTTLLGPVQIPRAYYLCSTCHHGQAPADTTLQIVAGSVSAGLAEVMTLLGATQDSFAEAATILERLTLVHVCPNSIRHVTETVGTQLLTQDRTLAQRQQDVHTCAAPTPLPRLPRIYLSMDGIQVHFRQIGWGEMKVGCVYHTTTRTHPTQPDQLIIRLDQPSYCAHRGDSTTFAALLWQDAVRRGVLEADEVIVLGDGSAWIWSIADSQFAGATQILDWYHASSYVWTAAQTIWPTDDVQRTQWTRTQLSALWDSRVEDVLHELNRHRDRGEAVTTTITYYTNQRSRMDYAAYRARGLQIGSGSIESACKQLVTSRLKGAGMIWDEAGAEAVVTVRAYLKSGRWDEAMTRRPPSHRSYARTSQGVPAACPDGAGAGSTLTPHKDDPVSESPTISPPRRRPPIPPAVHAQVRDELAAERAQHPWRRWHGPPAAQRDGGQTSGQAAVP